MAQGRRSGREKVWRRLIARQRRTGGTVKKFCRGAGVSEPSFYYWRRRLAGKPLRRPRLVPVRVVEGASRPAGGCVVETVLSGGRLVRIRAEADALAGVIRALEGTPRC